MFRFVLLWLGAILRLFPSQRDLLVENLALRQQLSVFQRRNRRPKLALLDKLFWVMARRFWSDWKSRCLWSLRKRLFAGIVPDFESTGA